MKKFERQTYEEKFINKKKIIKIYFVSSRGRASNDEEEISNKMMEDMKKKCDEFTKKSYKDGKRSIEKGCSELQEFESRGRKLGRKKRWDMKKEIEEMEEEKG